MLWTTSLRCVNKFTRSITHATRRSMADTAKKSGVVYRSSPKMMEIEISEDETEGRITLPGYSFSDINRAGVINPWCVALMGEAARWSFFHHKHPDGLQVVRYKDLARDKLIFMLTAKYTLYPAFYDQDSHLYHPVSLLYRLASIGNSSVQYLDETRSLLSGQLLHSCVFNQVMVNRETRRPERIPDWYREKFDHIKPAGSRGKFEVQEVPSDSSKVFRYEYKAGWSDSDYYYHINHASYIRICIDALSEAAVQGHLQCSKDKNLGPCQIQEMEMMYVAESLPNDVFDVLVWEDSEHAFKVHCTMMRGKQAVFHFSAAFYNR